MKNALFASLALLVAAAPAFATSPMHSYRWVGQPMLLVQMGEAVEPAGCKNPQCVIKQCVGEYQHLVTGDADGQAHVVGSGSAVCSPVVTAGALNNTYECPEAGACVGEDLPSAALHTLPYVEMRRAPEVQGLPGPASDDVGPLAR